MAGWKFGNQGVPGTLLWGGGSVREVVLPEKLLKQLRTIYEKLEREYDAVAGQLGFSCVGCPDNCCDSYFLHYTYTEWAFLWLGYGRLDPVEQKDILKKSQNYIKQSDAAKKSGERPLVMCPLNKGGLCVLYEYRLLVCRTHGVPAALTRPDGQKLQFPGCFRCQEVVQGRYGKVLPPHVERTPLLREFVLLEDDLFDNRRSLVPKVKMTIAEMIVKGPPVVPILHCQR
jgi:hypothetical protein